MVVPRVPLVALAATLALGFAVPAHAITVGPPSVREGIDTVVVDRSEGPTWPARSYRLEVVPETKEGTPMQPGEDGPGAPVRVEFGVGQRTAEVMVRFGRGRVIEPTEQGRFVLRDAEGTEVANAPFVIYDDDAEFAETELTVREAAGRVTARLTRPWALEMPVDYDVVAFGPDGRRTDVSVPPVRMEPGATGVSFDATFPTDPQAGSDRRFQLVLEPLHDPARTEQEQPRSVLTVNVLDDDSVAPTPRVTAPPGARIGRLVTTISADEAADAVASLEIGRAVARRLRVPRRLAVGGVELAAGQGRQVVLRIRRAVARRLRRARRVPATLRVVVEDAAGNRRTVTRRVVLRR
jgi:hypothetical protein